MTCARWVLLPMGQCESALGPWAAHAGPALEWVCKARATLARIREVAVARVHEEAGKALWCVLAQSAVRALTNDYSCAHGCTSRGATMLFCNDIQATLRTPPPTALGRPSRDD